jgi:endonuclease YncB( thermonuclease family)
MRRTAIALSATGLLAIGGGMLGLRGYLVPQPGTMIEHTAVSDEAGVSPPPRTTPEDPAKQARIRRVAPEIVAQPQIAPEELQRVEPRAALSRFGQPLPRRPKNHGRIFRPLISEAGRVTGSGLTVTIAGIEVTPSDETCVDTGGRNWPCGMRARSAFRSFVRGRALACDLPEELTEKHYTTACSLGTQDVGAWLVKHGWARALPGGSYQEAGEAARAGGKGIFGPAPVIENAEPLPSAEIELPTGTLPPPLE